MESLAIKRTDSIDRGSTRHPHKNRSFVAEVEEFVLRRIVGRPAHSLAAIRIAVLAKLVQYALMVLAWTRSLSSVGQGEVFKVMNTYWRSEACGAPGNLPRIEEDTTEN